MLLNMVKRIQVAYLSILTVRQEYCVNTTWFKPMYCCCYNCLAITLILSTLHFASYDMEVHRSDFALSFIAGGGVSVDSHFFLCIVQQQCEVILSASWIDV